MLISWSFSSALYSYSEVFTIIAIEWFYYKTCIVQDYGLSHIYMYTGVEHHATANEQNGNQACDSQALVFNFKVKDLKHSIPFIPLIFRSLEIMQLLLAGHGIPNLVALSRKQQPCISMHSREETRG